MAEETKNNELDREAIVVLEAITNERKILPAVVAVKRGKDLRSSWRATSREDEEIIVHEGVDHDRTASSLERTFSFVRLISVFFNTGSISSRDVIKLISTMAR